MEEKIENSIVIEEKPIKKKSKKVQIAFKVFSYLLLAICLTFSCIVLRFEVLYQTYDVEGISMQPTLNETGYYNSDLVYVNKDKCGKKGDIVVIERKGSPQFIIKRVIATGGDAIDIKGVGDAEILETSYSPAQYKEYAVFLNGVKLVENYINEPDNIKVMKVEYEKFWRYKKLADLPIDQEIGLTENQIFALGDNREHSTDSSEVGPFDVRDVVGRVDFISKYGTTAKDKKFEKFKYMFIFKN